MCASRVSLSDEANFDPRSQDNHTHKIGLISKIDGSFGVSNNPAVSRKTERIVLHNVFLQTVQCVNSRIVGTLNVRLTGVIIR